MPGPANGGTTTPDVDAGPGAVFAVWIAVGVALGAAFASSRSRED